MKQKNLYTTKAQFDSGMHSFAHDRGITKSRTFHVLEV